MEETEVFDFDKICRLCLLAKGSMSRIFAKKKRSGIPSLSMRIMSCTTLEVYEGDGLPKQICPKCLWSVNIAYSFREQCDVANAKLLKYVENMKMKGVSLPIKMHHVQDVDDNSNENDAQDTAPFEYLDEQIAILEHPIKYEGVNHQESVKNEPDEDIEDEDDDDKPISALINYSRVQKNEVADLIRAVGPAGLEHREELDEKPDDVETEGEDNGMPGESVSDPEIESVASASALVETEMREDSKPPMPMLQPLSATPPSPGEIIKFPRPLNVRRYLETEFSRDPTYNAHKKFFVVGNEYNKMKRKPKNSPEKSGPRTNGWDPYNVMDIKPRRKYAPREKNLISNNSSPIIEQDGTKSKFRACTHCGKVVLGKNMGIHVKIHVGNKSHLCDICGKSFLYKKTLETHKRVHSGERPCVCKICDKTFRSSSRLSDHMSTHTGKKPFICEICAVAFRIKGHLKKHLRVHSGEKPYVCSFCEKAFSDAWNMKCHLRIHTGEKPPHACPVCGQCFLRRNKMEEHCKLTHGEEYVLPRKQAIVQRLKNDLIEMNDELRMIAEREREDMLRQEAERQLLASHFESQRQELADHLAISVPMPIPVPVPAFPGNLPAGIFGLQ